MFVCPSDFLGFTFMNIIVLILYLEPPLFISRLKENESKSLGIKGKSVHRIEKKEQYCPEVAHCM